MLTKLTLQNFRSYSKKTFDFTSNATLFIGANAVGKTNILEAIYCLATGKSFRAVEEREVVRGGLGVGRVAAIVSNEVELELVWDNRERFQKLYRVNGVGKRQIDFVGHLTAVLFQPEDLEIVIGSPSLRRKYLDGVLSQAHKDYRLAHHIYEKALRQRNRLLLGAKKEHRILSRSQLEYWNALLIEKGAIIHNFRKGFIDFLNDSPNNFFPIKVSYDHSIISVARLEKYHQEELLAGTTLVGPHRDDFIVEFEDQSASGRAKFKILGNYGSRGQQRLGVLALKIGELDYVEKQNGVRPLLLLDDIFSELDKDNRQHVLDLISKQQTIMTTTDIHESEEHFLKKLHSNIIHLG